ncbi:hypothetical protein INR49_015999 [Caranx melampygus]|nr:hypothetical protein INR49_015999 [Caranx melampygus]
MQQIYRHSDEQFEVFTTVFSPQVCRRTRTRHVDSEKVVVAVVQYRSRLAKELDLNHGDLIQVLLRRTRPGGMDGCRTETKDGDPPSATPTLARRGSVPVVVMSTGASCGCTSTPRLLRKNSIRRPLGLDGPSAGVRGSGAQRLLTALPVSSTESWLSPGGRAAPIFPTLLWTRLH